MFTKGFPLGKRPIYCGHLQITYVYFRPDSEKISQTTIGAWTDTSRVCCCFLDDIKVFEPSEEGDSIDCASDSPMLQMIRKNEAPYRLSFYLDTARPKSQHHSLPI